MEDQPQQRPGEGGRRVLVEREPEAGIATFLLNRPERLNALSDALMEALVAALSQLDGDPQVRCIVLGGSVQAFPAGADVGEAGASAVGLYLAGCRLERWDAVRRVRTPPGGGRVGVLLGG